MGHLLTPAVPSPEETALLCRVVDEAGSPLEGVYVKAFGESGSPDGAETGADGKVRLTGLPAGWIFVVAVAENYTAEYRDDVFLNEGEQAVVVLRLGPGVPFDGRVVGPEREPMADASVTVVSGGTFEGMMYASVAEERVFDRVVTDANGRFHVHGIPPDAIATVLVQMEGFCTASRSVKAVGDTVRPTELVLQLERGGAIRGTVRSPEGDPVEGAEVFAVPAGNEILRENPRVSMMSSTGGGAMSSAIALTDVDGSFLLSGLPLDDYVAFAEADGFARSAESEVLRLTPESSTLEAKLVLRRPGTLVVRVTDPDGNPVTDAHVALAGGFLSPELDHPDKDGLYRFEGMTPGMHFVRVSSSRFLGRSVEVEVAPGGTAHATVALERGAAITGTLLDEAGEPVPGARLDAYRADPDEEAEPGWQSVTKATGRTDGNGPDATRSPWSPTDSTCSSRSR